MRISASIYAFHDLELEQAVERLDSFGVDYLHVDCNDDPAVFDDVARIRRVSNTPIDLHLVTPRPEAYFDAIRDTGIEVACFQYEDVGREIEIPEDVRARMGLSICPGTDPEVFAPYADRFAFLMVMTTTPGKSGGSFDDTAFSKIRECRRRYPSKALHVDGGVNDEVGYILRNLGVQVAVSGSFLRKSSTVGSGLLNLKAGIRNTEHRVRDFMMWPNELPCLHESQASVESVLDAIDRSRLGFVLLLDGEDRLSGVVSDGDVRRAMLRRLRGGKDLGVHLDELVNRAPTTVDGEATVGEMLELLQSRSAPITFLPVTTAERRVAGAVSFNNLLRSGL